MVMKSYSLLKLSDLIAMPRNLSVQLSLDE